MNAPDGDIYQGLVGQGMTAARDKMNPAIEILRAHGLSLAYASSTHGGEYCGPCCFCTAVSGDGGTDRLRVWPAEGRYWCRRCGARGPFDRLLAMGADMSVDDARTLLRSVGVPVGQASRRLTGGERMPSRVWRKRAAALIEECAVALWLPENHEMLEHLEHRGLRRDTILKHRHGAVTETLFEERAHWGLSHAVDPHAGTPKVVWIPRGILVPRYLDDEPVCLQVRVFDSRTDHRYIYVAGSHPVVKLIEAEASS